MDPRIEILKETKLAGKRLTMSFSQNRTTELWQNFMQARKEIRNSMPADLYSVEIYAPLFFAHFDPSAVFEKWAAIAVTDFDTIPPGMETITLPLGLYAVFLHKGPASEGIKTYEYIFKTWLPDSPFLLDHRPHFALMGEKYKSNDPGSEEEIWIPIEPKPDTRS